MKDRLTLPQVIIVIRDFAVQVAHAVVGGIILPNNHNLGDIFVQKTNTFFEVKASGLANGPIIVGEQLERQYNSLEHHDHYHVFVSYANRGKYKGKWRPLPVIKATSQKRLEGFLVENLKEIHIIHASVVKAIYDKEKARGKEKTYIMQMGPKTYVRIPYPELRALILGTVAFTALGLDSNDYLVK